MCGKIHFGQWFLSSFFVTISKLQLWNTQSSARPVRNRGSQWLRFEVSKNPLRCPERFRFSTSLIETFDTHHKNIAEYSLCRIWENLLFLISIFDEIMGDCRTSRNYWFHGPIILYIKLSFSSVFCPVPGIVFTIVTRMKHGACPRLNHQYCVKMASPWEIARYWKNS